ncbi:MAG: zinc-binding dehydrogenase [Streptomyces sp.]|nr:zinc-binding dehydrogenase [Streptomyces sp.]NUS81916.1 zinc-binding dehydrogenase [Streptomyces sp.]
MGTGHWALTRSVIGSGDTDDVPLATVRKDGKVATTTTAPAAALAAAGTLSVEVTTVLPLDQAADGLATIAAGKANGKIVVAIDD